MKRLWTPDQLSFANFSHFFLSFVFANHLWRDILLPFSIPERLDSLEFNLSLKLFLSHWLTFFFPSNLNSHLKNSAKSPFLIQLFVTSSLKLWFSQYNSSVHYISTIWVSSQFFNSLFSARFRFFITTKFIFLFWTFWTPPCHPLPSAEVILMTSNFYHDVIFHSPLFYTIYSAVCHFSLHLSLYIYIHIDIYHSLSVCLSVCLYLSLSDSLSLI